LFYGFLYPAVTCLFLAAVIIVAFEDLDTQEMSISVLLWMSGFAAAATGITLLPERINIRASRLVNLTGITLQDRIIGLFAVSVPLLIIGFVITPLIYRAVTKSKTPVYGFGMGDIVLMAAAGLMLGVKAVAAAVFIGIIIGAVYGIILRRIENNNDGKVSNKFAFGPFLCIGIVIALFFGNNIVNAYFNLF
jgi:leader peptidase (prepilin peptidase)/N-methyltransferase